MPGYANAYRREYSLSNLITKAFIFTSLFVLTSGCHVGRYFYWNLANMNDHKRFPSTTIEPSTQPRPLHTGRFFYPENIEGLYGGRFKDFQTFLDKSSTLAFLILHRDTIIHEYYPDGIDSTAVWPSFSVTKSVVSALVGIAVQDGYIEDIQDPVTRYLPAGFHPSLQKVKIVHLLDMQAGFNFREAYQTPFSPMATYYYGRHLDRYVRSLKGKEEPGLRYQYQSASTQLLGLAVEYSTGKAIMEYLEEHVWRPAGMMHGASWSLDRPGGRAKAFCCLNATPRDFARFGLLYAHEGRREGQAVIPVEWIRATRQASDSHRDSQGYRYGYQWRITDSGGMFAKGILGQYIYVHPEHGIVIVRMGEKSLDLDWGLLFEHIDKQLRQ